MGAKENKKKKHSRKWVCVYRRGTKKKKKKELEYEVVTDPESVEMHQTPRSTSSILLSSSSRLGSGVESVSINRYNNLEPVAVELIDNAECTLHPGQLIFGKSKIDIRQGLHGLDDNVVPNQFPSKSSAETSLLPGPSISDFLEIKKPRDLHELERKVGPLVIENGNFVESNLHSKGIDPVVGDTYFNRDFIGYEENTIRATPSEKGSFQQSKIFSYTYDEVNRYLNKKSIFKTPLTKATTNSTKSVHEYDRYSSSSVASDVAQRADNFLTSVPENLEPSFPLKHVSDEICEQSNNESVSFSQHPTIIPKNYSRLFINSTRTYKRKISSSECKRLIHVKTYGLEKPMRFPSNSNTNIARSFNASYNNSSSLSRESEDSCYEKDRQWSHISIDGDYHTDLKTNTNIHNNESDHNLEFNHFNNIYDTCTSTNSIINGYDIFDDTQIDTKGSDSCADDNVDHYQSNIRNYLRSQSSCPSEDTRSSDVINTDAKSNMNQSNSSDDSDLNIDESHSQFDSNLNTRLHSDADIDRSDSHYDSSPNTRLDFDSNVDESDSHYDSRPDTRLSNISEISDRNSSHTLDDGDPNTVINFEEAVVDGRRITDITYMFQSFHEKFDQHNDDCPCRLRDLCMYNVSDRGMRTRLSFVCLNCGYQDNVWTNPMTPAEKLPILESLLYGLLTSGIGYSTIQEVFAAMSVPFVTSRTFRKNTENLVDLIKALCEKELKEAGRRERELAIAEGRVLHGKYPYTHVIEDGVWSQRSFAHSRYNALSGTAVLISAFTKRILFVGVRNKACSVCDEYENPDLIPPHRCKKNWGHDQPSTAMEADIVLDGFTRSMEMHGLIYETLIGDGDSSVYDIIKNNEPYQMYGVSVKKIECDNHLFRCFGIAMDVISKKRVNENPFPRGFMTKIRERIRTSALKMRRYVEKCRDFWQDQDVPLNEKRKNLLEDISNMIGHFFGNHTACRLSEDCNRSEDDVTPELQKVGFYADIDAAVNRLARNSASILEHKNNNPAECYNSIHNKTNGGRRINYSMRESYLLRAYLAAIQFNTQEALSKLCEFKGFPVPTAVTKMEESRKAQNLRTALYRRRKGRKVRSRTGADKDYGVNCNKPDIPQDLFDDLVQQHFKKLIERQLKRDQIEQETIGQHTSEIWREYRRSMITASKFGQICRMRERTSCHNLVNQIRYPKHINTPATNYGIIHEAQALKDLAERCNIEIRPCGLFIDAEEPYLGASPDGLEGEHGIVEVKCLPLAKDCTPQVAIETIAIYKRIFNKKNPELMNINHYYYYQVQGQLHITQKQYCIFAVWTPLGIKHIKVPRDDEFWRTEMKQKLERFYMECLLPEIIDSRRNRKKRIRDPEYILNAKRTYENSTPGKKKRKLNEQDSQNPVPENAQDQSSPRQSGRETPCDSEDNSSTDTNDVGSSNQPTANGRTNNNAWVIISDDEDDEREPEDGELDAIDTVIRSITDEEIIPEIESPTSLLTSSAIDQFLKIVKEQSNFNVFYSHYFPHSHLITPSFTTCDLHIIGGNTSRHWCCIHYDGTHIFIYDSLGRIEYELLTREEKKYIRRRYPHVPEDNIIGIPMTRQPDGVSCGVYAVAVVTTLVIYHDPIRISRTNYSRDAIDMRQHMISIIRRKRLTEFPTIDE